ncbi:MAG: bifunctional nuclease family protein [Chitinispirillaceae bacterium]|nr:bifunctional nuclease family protein [Chitinispirillaceae bacterium]
MIRVEVINTFLVNMGKEFVILLRGTDDERTLPISIGQLEAQSIALQLNEIPFPRPLTHDLFKNVLDELGGTVLRTEICALKNETFFARLVLQIGDKTIDIDARPSDAIAMALRFSAPVLVDEEVMEEAGIVIPEAEDKNTGIDSESLESNEKLSEMTPVEQLRQKLTTAITEERYEDAAKLRDEINKLTTSN